MQMAPIHPRAKKRVPLLCALAIGLSSTTGRAGPPPPKAPRYLRLEYVRTPEAQSCSDAKIFKDAVTLGYRLDPFDDAAAARMRVTISRLGARYQANIEVRDGAGNVVWTKEVLPRPRCETLINQAGLDVYLWLRETFPIEADPPRPSTFPRFVRFDYVRPPNRYCPAAKMMQDAIGGGMSYDPFVEPADGSLVVTIRHEAQTYRVHAEIRDLAGKALWTRDQEGVECVPMMAGMSFSISMALSSSTATATATAPTPAQPAEPPPKRPDPPSVSPAPPKPAKLPSLPPPERLRFALGVSGALAMRTADPLLAGQLVADAGIRWRAFSMAGELRWTLPMSVESGQASATEVTGGLVPCEHLPAFFVCGVAQVTAVVGMPAQSLMLPSDQGLTAALGARLGKVWPASGSVAARTSVDLLGTLHQVAIHYDDRPVGWTTPGITIAVGAGFVMGL